MDLQNILKNAVCLLLTVVHKIDAVYILTKEEYTYLEAVQICTLATPNLIFNETGITPDLDMALGTDVWLGYIETLTPFEYFGCVRKSDLHLTTANFTTEGDPGKCWSACNSVALEAVAVYKHECFCLQKNTVDVQLRSSCEIECPTQENIVCGGNSWLIYEHVSLYKTTYTGPTKKSDYESNICLWYNKTDSEFIWGKCTEEFAIVCYKDEDIQLYHYRKDYWIYMTNKCFKNDKIPSDYNNTINLTPTQTSAMWTGIIRSGVVYPITDDSMTGKYGYISNTTGRVIFSHNDTIKKRALCLQGTIVTDKTTPGQPTTKSSDYTTTSDHTSDTQNEGTSDVGAIVGATLSIIIVIIVVVVILVMWKRGIKLPFAQSKRRIDNDLNKTTNPTYNDFSLNNSTQDKCETTTSDYAEVDESKISPDCIMTQDEHANRTNYSLDEPHAYITLKNVDEGPYDTTKTPSARHDQQTSNEYNKISLEESSSYDHIGAHVNDSKTLGLDNPYNTTTLATINRHNVFTNNAFNRKDESDDAYNHTEDQSRQTERNKSDNSYNTTALGHLRNDQGVTSIAFNSKDA